MWICFRCFFFRYFDQQTYLILFWWVICGVVLPCDIRNIGFAGCKLEKCHTFLSRNSHFHFLFQDMMLRQCTILYALHIWHVEVTFNWTQSSFSNRKLSYGRRWRTEWLTGSKTNSKTAGHIIWFQSLRIILRMFVCVCVCAVSDG